MSAAVSAKRQDFLQKWFEYFEREQIQASIRHRLVDPILNHVLERVFPYIILICVMFSLLLVSVLLTLGIVIFQIRGGGLAAAVAAVRPTG